MPTYDVKCSACEYEGQVTLRMSEINDWEKLAHCPQCQQEHPHFARIIKMAPSVRGGEKSAARLKASQKLSQRESFVNSGQKDDMRHKEAQRRDQNQVAEAVEIVRSGKFEGF